MQVKHYLLYFDFAESSLNFYNMYRKVKPLALCGLSWWNKPENPKETTNFRQATFILPQANTGNQNQTAAVTGEGLTPSALSDPGPKHNLH